MQSLVTKILVFCISLISVSMAVHPGLESAINNDDMKTALTLVKKIGVKDIYCPASLSYENSMKLYGDTFSEEPSKMWEICDSAFIQSAEKVVCKTSVSLCKELLRRTSVYQWEPLLRDVLESGLNIAKEKRKVKKEKLKKISKQECKNELERAKQVAEVILNQTYASNCDPKDSFSTISCSLIYLPMKDSVEKMLKKQEKQCNSNPRIKVTKEVEELQKVNPFLYEAEVYGVSVMWRLQDVFDSFSNMIESLKLYNGLKKNDLKSSQIMTDIIKDFKMRPKEEKHMVYTAACIVDPQIQRYYHPGDNFNCKEEIKENVGNENLYLSAGKKYLIKEIASNYASKGWIPDYLMAYACRLYPEIEKDIFKLAEIKMIDCNFLNEYVDENRKCVENDSIYMWKSSTGVNYVCDDKKWRAPRTDELEINFPCSEKNLGATKDGKFCWFNGWIKDYGYSVLEDDRDSHKYLAVDIGSQRWMANNLYYELDDCKYRYTAFYNWNTIKSLMLQENDSGLGGRQTVCPNGWHLPDSTEWEKLFETVGGKEQAGKMLKSTSKSWNNSLSQAGEDIYGFEAFPYNLYNSYYRNGYEDGLTAAYFLSYTKSKQKDSESNISPRIVMIGGNDNISFVDHSHVDNFENVMYYTIRCVKD